MRNRNNRVVYSTGLGRICPDCGRPVARCTCKGKRAAPKRDGIVRVERQTKGRKGKGVSLITGLPLNEAGLKKLAKQLKGALGAGGAVKDGVIEIQGDHRERLVEELTKLGHKAKIAGG